MPMTATSAGKIAITHILYPTDAISAAIARKNAARITVLMTRLFLAVFKSFSCVFSGSSSNFIAK